MKLQQKFFTFLVILFVSALTVSAFAAVGDIETGFWTRHTSLGTLTDGHTDFSNARYLGLRHRLGVGVISGDNNTYPAPNTSEYKNLKGSITINGGEYSYVEGNVLQTVEGTVKTFKLTDAGHNDAGYYITSGDTGFEFLGGPDGGLNNVKLTWTFDDNHELDGSQRLPEFQTTEELLSPDAGFLPYVEFILDDDNKDFVTGLKWRIVKSNDMTKAVSLDTDIVFIVDGIQCVNGYGEWPGFEVYKTAGTVLSADASSGDYYAVQAEGGIPSSDIYCLRIAIAKQGEDYKEYGWRFYNPNAKDSYFWGNHISQASLDKDGKADFEGAKFYGLYMSVINDFKPAEGKHFFELGQGGSMTISGGDYKIIDDEVNEGTEIESVASGTSMTFPVGYYDGYSIGDTFMEYQPHYDGKEIMFDGEKSLNGKTVSWTFSDDLDISAGSATVPTFKSVSEQLASCVPYVEVVSSDGIITNVKCRLVSNDVTKTVSIPDSGTTNYRIDVLRKSGNRIRSGWYNKVASADFALTTSLDVSNFRGVNVRYRYGQAEISGVSYVYQWNFRFPSADSGGKTDGGNTPDTPDTPTDPTSPDTSSNTPGSSGGGCSVGTGALALAFLGFVIARKHKQ